MTDELQPPLQMWGGVECTINRVNDQWFDQLAWSGHYGRLDDIDRIASLGLRTLRWPILWERVAPNGEADIDWRETDRRLARLRDLGITPIVGLVHHGSGPASTSLLDDGFPEALARFAGCVARRYPWLDAFTPVNEPLTTARFSGLYGLWYPHGRSDRQFVRALVNELRGVVLAMRAIREVNPNATLVQTEDCGQTFGTPALRSQVAHENGRRWLTWDLLTGRVDKRHPMFKFLSAAGMTAEDVGFFANADCPPDVLGLNYYVTSDRFLDDRIERYPAATHGGNKFMKYADVEAVRARPEGILGHAGHLKAAWARYKVPMAVTEVHIGCTREEQMRWLVEAWRGALRARAEGADVRAITAWALLGSFNWDSLVTRDAGHYEPGAFDVRGSTPRRTALANVIASLAAGCEPSHPALRGTPWWHRADRLIHGPSIDEPLPAASGAIRAGAPMILIVGDAGRSDDAIKHVCDTRGLAAHVGSHHEMEAMLSGLQPWAALISGRSDLADACHQRGIPVAIISSDGEIQDLAHAALDRLIDAPTVH